MGAYPEISIELSVRLYIKYYSKQTNKGFKICHL